MRPKESKYHKRTRVATLLTRYINRSPLSQSEITVRSGFNKSNIITMLKQGRTDLALCRVKAMADAVDMPPALLLKAWFRDRSPNEWEVLLDVIRRDEAYRSGVQ